VFVRADRARESLDAIPQLTLVVAAGGHAPWFDEPDLVAEAVLGFLDGR
jgi:pimeloyl-ACP methyl ester carboxylesterase